MNTSKERVIATIDSYAEELTRLSHGIHANPEIAFTERKSSTMIAGLLERHGYHVAMGLGGLETAFIATQEGTKEGPHVAFLAEYDSLPGIGHGCGHNIIATCAAGAFLGAASVIDTLGGKVSIIGTPAEESGAGKAILLEAGAFDGVDFALMMHPTSGKSIIKRGGRAATTVDITFRGKAAHSSVPGLGINALSAVICTFQNIDVLRSTFEMQDNVNGVIMKGGTAANVIPDEAACTFSVRARTLLDLRALVEKLKRAAQSASLLTGAIPEVSVHRMYAERYPNGPMCEAFKENMSLLGEEMGYPDPNVMYGSSDIGNVSIKLPAIHDYLWIAGEEVNSHSKEFAEAAISPRADEVCIKGAKGLAMTAVDILSDGDFQVQINGFHREQVPPEYRREER
jgi:amidohydrolase